MTRLPTRRATRSGCVRNSSCCGMARAHRSPRLTSATCRARRGFDSCVSKSRPSRGRARPREAARVRFRSPFERTARTRPAVTVCWRCCHAFPRLQAGGPSKSGGAGRPRRGNRPQGQRLPHCVGCSTRSPTTHGYAKRRSARHATVGRQPRGAGRADGRRLARSRDATTLLRGWTDGDRLILALDAEPTSPLAWWSAVSALESLARPWTRVASDTRWSPSELAGARRVPELPPVSSLPGGLDTRAAWTVVLALLLMEEWRRRREPRRPAAEVTDAT